MLITLSHRAAICQSVEAVYVISLAPLGAVSRRFILPIILFKCKDIGLAVNIGKTKYMKIGRHRGVIANSHIKIGSNSYEKVKRFKYLGSLLTNTNSIHEEI